MHKRIRATGTAVSLAVTLGAFGLSGVAMAGEDGSTPPPPETVTVPGPTQTVTVPGPPETVTVPGPTKTVTVEAHAPKAPKESSSSGSSSGSSRSGSNTSTTSPSTSSVTSVALTNTATGTDTGTIPHGGVQAGAGGMSADGGPSAVLALGLGLLAFGLTAGGVTMRRRALER